MSTSDKRLLEEFTSGWDATACPQPAEAEIRPLDGNSRFDPDTRRLEPMMLR
jgi:hypothetical protein